MLLLSDFKVLILLAILIVIIIKNTIKMLERVSISLYLHSKEIYVRNQFGFNRLGTQTIGTQF